MDKDVKVTLAGSVEDFRVFITRSTAFTIMVANVKAGNVVMTRRRVKKMMRHALANAEWETELMFTNIDWDVAEVKTRYPLWSDADA